MRPITAVVVAGAAALMFGCEGSGSPTSAESPLGCQTLQGGQNVNNWSNCLSFTGGGSGGNGGTGGNGAGLAPAALYRLIRVNGNPLPFNLDSGGVEDSVVTTDSTRIKNFILDSSYISLNADSTVTRIDYMTIRDYRVATVHPPANFNKAWFSLADSSAGTFTDSTGQPEILLQGFQTQNVGWQYAGDTLFATAPFEASDSVGTQIITNAYFTYQNVGAPYNNTQRVVPHYRHQLHAASSTTPVGQPRPGSASLSFMRSDDGSGRLVRVIRQ